MSETGIAAAIAAQMEHEKRSQSCQRVIGKPHRYTFVDGELWMECDTCGVTPSSRDYDIKIEASATKGESDAHPPDRQH